MGSEQVTSKAILKALPTMAMWQKFAIAGSVGIVSGWTLIGTPARAEESTPTAAPVETSAESLLRPQAPAPEPAAPAVQPVTPPAPAPQVAPAQPNVPESYNGSFIDPTEYGVGATRSPNSPTVVFSERSTGCRITVAQGQTAPARSCGGAAPAVGGVAGYGANGDAGATGGSGTQAGSGNVRVGPVTVGIDGVTVGNTTLISREALNASLRPLNVIRRGVEEFIFPLATPAPITSLFGWRTHPIFGDSRFHAGTDLGAPTGTPILAAKAGTVITADYLGGYGLTVILRHEDGNQETRYAHMSQLMVRPGETVEQGEVIGLVGSTGNSTGPHLHFELRQLTAQGWVLVDPNDLLAYAKVNLMHTLNQPLQALSALTGAQAEAATELEPVEIPYRPAQPNAS
ncbi:M23 family metallopeptidase [Leptolyngbya sp. PCC 6406]|uniref:M23 family metallopeptidase n=1 Tax=Leptolyngbya sp. PCC 6406 TaxID=1173264 RepID=UPI0027297D0D|nr:M23 family metallopeptidase [Leptolyngbya sp. PCC 6406]